MLINNCNDSKDLQKYDQLTEQEWIKLEFEFCRLHFSKEKIIYVPVHSNKKEIECIPLKDPTSSKYFYKYTNFF